MPFHDVRCRAFSWSTFSFTVKRIADGHARVHGLVKRASSMP